jgi:hypothetical protein
MASRKNRLKNRAELLELLKTLPKNKRIKIVKLLDDNSIHTICECLCNLFKNTFNLPSNKCGFIRKKFSSHKKDILKLINPETSVKKKKSILTNNQYGSGLFTILASVALPAIIAALTK